MKHKFSSMGRVAIALVLALSLCLVMAVPAAVMGQGSSTYAGYQFGTGGTVTWDEATKDTGNYSVKLDEDATALTYVEFIPAPGTTMSDLDVGVIAEWSFRYHMVAGTSGGPNMELRFTAPDCVDADDPEVKRGHADVNTQATGFTAGEWTTEDAVASLQVQTYFNDPVDGTAGAFDSSPFYLLSETLAAIDAHTAMTDHGSSAADWELTRVRIELADSTNRICYIDDVTIDGVTYELEPMALDAERYSIGETVDVTVCNGNANADSMAIDTVDITVKSVTDTTGDTVTLTETGSATGVFTGPITLLGAPPADREADEIVVSAEDTVTVTYTDGNWGAGTQTIVLTADVDDTAPVITIVSPADEAIIIDATPEIKASYLDDGSGIDETSVVITVDTVIVTASVTGSSVTYTPSADLDDGSHAVTVDVSDKAGNAATASWSFTVDTLAPVITDPEATPPVVEPEIENTIVFTAPVTDATSGVDTVTINVSSIDTDTALAMLDDGIAPDVEEGDGIYTAEITTTLTEAGSPYTLTVTAIDLAELSATADITLVVSSDTVPPEITDLDITYPFVGVDSAQPDDEVTIFATVTDDVLMGTVTAECDVVTELVGEETVPIVIDLLDGGVTPDVEADDGIYTGTATVDSDAGWGDYPVTITATDDKGNEAIDETLILAVRYGATGVPINLVKGWNLISLPLIPGDADITVVISATTLLSGDVSSVGTVRGYDPATGDFPLYIPGTGGALTEMEDGVGYWVFMEEADTLTITGREMPAPPEVPPTYDVVVGWNLIGFKSLTPMIDNVLDTDEGYLLNIEGTYPVLWSYDATAGAYSNVKGVTDGMVVGHGFWIWITEAGTIVPPQ